MTEEKIYTGFCLFPIRQVSPGSAKWEQVTDKTGQRGALTLVDPGAESDFSGGYAFVPHSEVAWMADKFPGMRQEVYIKIYNHRAKEKTTLLFLKDGDLREFNLVSVPTKL